MNSSKKNARSPLVYARTAGVLYLLLAPLGIFGILYVPMTLIAPGDAAATANNVIASESLFRLSIVAALMTQLVNLLLVLLLYKLLKPVNKQIAVLMVIFLLAAVPIAMLNELNQVVVLLLLSGAEYLTVFTAVQLQSLSLLFINLHEYGIYIAGIFWGLWLFPMGYLVFRSGFLPRILGVLLMIGCFGYLIDSFTAFLLPGFGVEVAAFTFWGEVLLPLWLLIKGVNVERWEKLADE
ncbi:MAG: DUF4386 family protein [Anaerolineae bacterium]|nr:DUF4386 family protein [Anaerolineae bacterium]